MGRKLTHDQKTGHACDGESLRESQNPARSVPDFRSAKVPNAADALESAEALRGKRILVVEDTVDNQLLLERLLKKHGAVVGLAENGEEGVAKALAEAYDLVLMDVQMPRIDGCTAVRRLREHRYERPVLALTAHAMIEDRVRCLEAGYTDYLTKPIQVPEFLRTLGRYLALPAAQAHHTNLAGEASIQMSTRHS